jgi:hypothetical protein
MTARHKEPVCRLDPARTRMVAPNGFRYSHGCVPTEPCLPVEGYLSEFEPGAGDWPDTYFFDVVLSHEKIGPVMTDLFSLLPDDVTPMLDVRGDDAYREMDPYIGLEPVTKEEMLTVVNRFQAFLFDDGHCGFGAMAEEPFCSVYLDDHKVIAVRIELARGHEVEAILEEHGIATGVNPTGVDAVGHEHRDVLWTDENRSELLDFYGVLDELRFRWNLELNIDPETNIDDDGRQLGLSAWRVLLYLEPTAAKHSTGKPPRGVYAELLLTAGSLQEADRLAAEACDLIQGYEPVDQPATDRIRPDELAQALGREAEFSEPQVHRIEIIP